MTTCDICNNTGTDFIGRPCRLCWGASSKARPEPANTGAVTDIVERLRALRIDWNYQGTDTATPVREAAAEIERLRSELTNARRLLLNVSAAIFDAGGFCDGPGDLVAAIGRLAAERDALRTAGDRLADDVERLATVTRVLHGHGNTAECVVTARASADAWREARGDQ